MLFGRLFWRLWAQYSSPNCLHFRAVFEKVSKCLNFSCESIFGQLFIYIGRLCAQAHLSPWSLSMWSSVGSVTRWRIKKLPNFYQKFAKNRPEKFFFKSHAYHNSPKISQIIGLHLWENKLSMPFKSCPIWSHWVASGYWDNCSCCCSKTTKECATATHFLTRPLLTKIDLFLLFLRYSNNCPKDNSPIRNFHR